MKIKASDFLKQVVSVLVSIAKAKSTAVKSKTKAVKTRLLIFGLLIRNKKVLLSAISHKIHELMGQQDDDDDDDRDNAIVLYNAAAVNEVPLNTTRTATVQCDEEEEDDDDYPDLRHSLFDLDGEEDEEDGDLPVDSGTGSVIELVRNSREERGSEFSLEEEIDHVADVFIRRFHRQMRMQKQQSFKRYQEMLERSL